MPVPLVLIGGGGHCMACIDVIETLGIYSIKGIVDKKEKAGRPVLGYKIISHDNEIPQLAQKFDNFLITLGQIKTPEKRVKFFLMLEKLKVSMPVLISPHAWVSRNSRIKKGTIIMHHALVNAGAAIGNNCIINSKALVEHGAVIGDHCHISTGAIVNGGADVKEGCFIGSGAIIRQGISIGEKSVIGAGVRVMKNVEAETLLTQ
ncbi:MAG: acetyltransferase [Deltaproteobacteria bacterium]|nr:acetyltransferase [Deltaproteobacteria bacterium]